MKVLLAASEVAPIIKLGGLGDVAGSLPKALSKLNINIDVIAPYFSFANMEGLNAYKSIDLNIAYNGKNNLVEVWNTKLPGSDVDVLLLRNSDYFSGYGGKGTSNVSENDTFSFFDAAVVAYIKSKFNTYDLIHCNDWHTGLITALLSEELGSTRPATLYTIHNLMYQGISDLDTLRKIGIVPGTHPLIDYDILDGDLNFMQQALSASDFINTVSPSYAREILDGKYPIDISDIIKSREGRFSGILNGLDYSQFPRNFDKSNYEGVRPENKKSLRAKLGLPDKNDKPIFTFIGRLDPNQKGIDILYDVVPYIVEKGGQFVLLGSGNSEWEKKYADLCNTTSIKENVSINTKLDLELANMLYSGSDFLVVPSKYEPCGLIQMIALWYGSLPIVNNTGGLKDTIVDGVNGFKFSEYSSSDLRRAIDRAFETYKTSKMSEMIVKALEADFSWDRSAQEYKKLYGRVLQLRLESKFEEAF